MTRITYTLSAVSIKCTPHDHDVSLDFHYRYHDADDENHLYPFCDDDLVYAYVYLWDLMGYLCVVCRIMY